MPLGGWETFVHLVIGVVDIGNHQPSVVLIKCVGWVSGVMQSSVLSAIVPLLMRVVPHFMLDHGILGRPVLVPVLVLGRQNEVVSSVF